VDGSSPVLSSSSELLELLALPCDAWCAWLPGGSSDSSSAGGGGGGTGTWRKTAPPLPDFLCIVANPVLTFERLWSVRLHCSRAAVAQALKEQQKQQQQQPRQSPADRRLTLAAVLSLQHSMSDELAAAAVAAAVSSARSSGGASAAASAGPATAAAASVPSAPSPPAPVMPLRLAHMPVHQQRVFYVDWPMLLPAPSCIDPAVAQTSQQAQHAQAHKLASTMSAFI
jgi:hypothetical protein